MTTLREAAQQALEALIDAQRHHYALKHKETDDLVATLRAALAEPVKTEMTRDDIIRLAREAGWDSGLVMLVGNLEVFAALVAAEKDREIKRLQDMLYEQLGELTALRAEKQMRTRIEQLKGSVDETTLDVSGTTCFSPEPAKWPERSVKEKEQPR